MLHTSHFIFILSLQNILHDLGVEQMLLEAFPIFLVLFLKKEAKKILVIFPALSRKQDMGICHNFGQWDLKGSPLREV